MAYKPVFAGGLGQILSRLLAPRRRRSATARIASSASGAPKNAAGCAERRVAAGTRNEWESAVPSAFREIPAASNPARGPHRPCHRRRVRVHDVAGQLGGPPDRQAAGAAWVKLHHPGAGRERLPGMTIMTAIKRQGVEPDYVFRRERLPVPCCSWRSATPSSGPRCGRCSCGLARPDLRALAHAVRLVGLAWAPSPHVSRRRFKLRIPARPLRALNARIVSCNMTVALPERRCAEEGGVHGFRPDRLTTNRGGAAGGAGHRAGTQPQALTPEHLLLALVRQKKAWCRRSSSARRSGR